MYKFCKTENFGKWLQPSTLAHSLPILELAYSLQFALQVFSVYMYVHMFVHTYE